MCLANTTFEVGVGSTVCLGVSFEVVSNFCRPRSATKQNRMSRPVWGRLCCFWAAISCRLMFKYFIKLVSRLLRYLLYAGNVMALPGCVFEFGKGLFSPAIFSHGLSLQGYLAAYQDVVPLCLHGRNLIVHSSFCKKGYRI